MRKRDEKENGRAAEIKKNTEGKMQEDRMRLSKKDVPVFSIDLKECSSS